MKSPIKDLTRELNGISIVKELVPEGSMVDSYLFYGGTPELSLCYADREVNAITNCYVVYEFWKCMQVDPQRVYDIVTCEDFKFNHPEMFPVLQEHWHTYSNPYLRSAMFFLLNRCSEKGLISSGELSHDNYTSLSINYLKRYKISEKFNLKYVPAPGAELTTFLTDNTESDFLYIAPGNFSYNLFEQGKSMGPEQTSVNNRKLQQFFNDTKSKVILHYNYHAGIANLYGDKELILIDQYGRRTTDLEKSKEVIIANF